MFPVAGQSNLGVDDTTVRLSVSERVVKANKWIRVVVANVWFQGKTKILKINPSAASGICLRSAITVAAPLPCQHSYYHRELWELIHQWPMNDGLVQELHPARAPIQHGCLFYDCSPPWDPIFLRESHFFCLSIVLFFFNLLLKFIQGPEEEK